MNGIRKIFSQENQVGAGLFSYNSEGACPVCGGTGTVEWNLSFMDKMKVTCSEYQGTRYKKEVLQYTYKEKDIVEVMKMTVAEAIEFFETKDIRCKLQSLVTVGWQYIT